jgi:hypothetical protein
MTYYYVKAFDVTPGSRVGSQRLEDEFQSVANGFGAVGTEINRAIKILGTPAPPDQVINLSAAQRAGLVVGFDSQGNVAAIDAGVTTLSGVSSSAVVINTGTQNFAASTGRQWAAGQYLLIASAAAPSNYMNGQVTSYNAGTGALVMNITSTGGAGTPSDWVITVSGTRGVSGPQYVDTVVDKGTVAAAGTAAVVIGTSDRYQRIQAAGALTITISGWPASGILGELLLKCVNFGGKTITWPTINWVTGDGSFTTTFASNGVAMQAAGTDFVLLWTDNGGTTIYGKVMR